MLYKRKKRYLQNPTTEWFKENQNNQTCNNIVNDIIKKWSMK